MVRVIEHSQADPKLLLEIVGIKKLSWNYTEQEHLDWINKHLEKSDIHLLTYEENEITGYVNLVDIKVLVDDIPVAFIGIGNVCSRYKGRGDGKRLMDEVNRYLLDTGQKGLLFCKNPLVDFYRKCNWQLIPNMHPNPNINTMTFNFQILGSTVKYRDRLF